MEGSGRLTPDQIKEILAPQSKSTGKSTEPREISVWYKQDHIIKEDGCDNPNCTDPRPRGERGRDIMCKVDDKCMCRYCFLAGWLSPNGTN